MKRSASYESGSNASSGRPQVPENSDGYVAGSRRSASGEARNEDDETDNSRSVKKRTREKKRRDEVNLGLDTLASLLYRIEPSLKSGLSASDVARSRRNPGNVGQTTISNRVELINYAIKVIERLHTENEERKSLILRLTSGVAEHGDIIARTRASAGGLLPVPSPASLVGNGLPGVLAPPPGSAEAASAAAQTLQSQLLNEQSVASGMSNNLGGIPLSLLRQSSMQQGQPSSHMLAAERFMGTAQRADQQSAMLQQLVAAQARAALFAGHTPSPAMPPGLTAASLNPNFGAPLSILVGQRGGQQQQPQIEPTQTTSLASFGASKEEGTDAPNETN